MRLRHLAAALLLVVPFAACAREGGEKLTVSGRDFGFSGVPDEIRGGVADLTFTNDGEADHEIAFMRTDGDATIDDFKKGFPAILQGGPFPKFLTGGAVPGEIPPGETLRTRVTLPAGEYVLFCALNDEPGEAEGTDKSKPHYDMGMIQEVTVSGDEEAAELTAPSGEFTAEDYTFVTPDDVQPGEREYVFRNGSNTQWHHMVLQEFAGDVSASDAVNAFGTLAQLDPGKAPPPGTPEAKPAGSTGIMGPGMSQTVELTFQPNRTYVAACFIQDVTGGPPHAFGHKMVKAFTVTG